MTKTVGIREAKARFSHYVELARSGGEVIVTDRGKPVVRMVAIASSVSRSEDEILAELADTGLIELGTGTPAPLRTQRPRRRVSITRVVREMRR